MRDRHEEAKAQDLISEFFANGGVAKTFEDVKQEFSEFGGKTRSHLDFADKIGATILDIKHEWEKKKFSFGGHISMCTRMVVRRGRKGACLPYFRFDDGSRRSQAYITRRLKSGWLKILRDEKEEEPTVKKDSHLCPIHGVHMMFVYGRGIINDRLQCFEDDCFEEIKLETTTHPEDEDITNQEECK